MTKIIYHQINLFVLNNNVLIKSKIKSHQTKGWSQAIAARPVELEKEIWF